METASWRARIEDAASRYEPLVPVVKGNGYGFGREVLEGIAAEVLAARASPFPPTIAVGTVHELSAVPADVRALVLTPVARRDSHLLRDHSGPVVATVGTGRDVQAVAGWRGGAVIKLESSMHRFGAPPADVAAVERDAATAGLTIAGYGIHLPLAGSDVDRVAEVEAWLGVLERTEPREPTLWLSHLGADAHRTLAAAHTGWSFPMRIGTAMWHGDKAALHLSADVVGIRSVAAGTRAGYHATPAPSDGSLVIVGAGSAHGIATLDDGRSPFHFQRRRLALLEGPHMHTSTLFVPDGDPCPAFGDAIDVQRPLISVSVDELIWA